MELTVINYENTFCTAFQEHVSETDTVLSNINLTIASNIKTSTICNIDYAINEICTIVVNIDCLATQVKSDILVNNCSKHCSAIRILDNISIGQSNIGNQLNSLASLSSVDSLLDRTIALLTYSCNSRNNSPSTIAIVCSSQALAKFNLTCIDVENVSIEGTTNYVNITNIDSIYTEEYRPAVRLACYSIEGKCTTLNSNCITIS